MTTQDNIIINEGSINKPVIILFGPRSIGKTVLLVRLCNYINMEDNFSYMPNPNFRNDEEYINVMDSFKKSVDDANKKRPPSATGDVNFILIDINDLDRGTFCQILECPGEHFFRLDNSEEEDQPDFEDYFMDIIEAPYKKIYIFFLQVSMPDGIRDEYKNRISNFIKNHVKYSDEVIILYAQTDKDIGFINQRNERPIIQKYKNDFKINYKEIQTQLKIKRIKTKILPFSSGSFRALNQNNQEQERRLRIKWKYSNDQYFRKLWINIFELVSGRRKQSLLNFLFGK